jgi:hypothetical protein
MKVNDYFKQLQQQSLSDERKSLIFSRVQRRKINKFLWMKHLFSYKRVFYTLIVIGGIVFVF